MDHMLVLGYTALDWGYMILKSGYSNSFRGYIAGGSEQGFKCAIFGAEGGAGGFSG